MEFLFGRPLSRKSSTSWQRIEEMDDVTAIDDEVRAIVERNWPHLLSKLPATEE